MARLIRTVIKRFFIIANCIVVVFFGMACLNAFLHPAKWWFIAFTGLAFPFLLVLVFGFFIFWLVFRSKWALLPLLTMVAGYSNIRALLGFNYGSTFPEKKTSPAHIRVMSWNVHAYTGQVKKSDSANHERNDILKFIRQKEPDIICMQEFIEIRHKTFFSNVQDIQALGYPYHYRVTDYERRKDNFQLGVVIFSKYPIIDSIHFRYPGPQKYRASESLIGADIKINNDTIRVYNTHLQSVLFGDDEFRKLEIIKNVEDSLVDASRSIVRKLKLGYSYRGDQVDIVRRELDASAYPEIICGDFNDIPNSYTYFRVKGDRQDAFQEKGAGIGRTFSSISPTLRIDYIMADKQFEVTGYKSYVLSYSDHYPVLTDLRLRRQEVNDEQ